jgi:hypothetical protein
MSLGSLLTTPLLDDDDDVSQVQEFAATGARTGASLGAPGGPIGAGVGAGLGSAAGYLAGYALTGVDPAERIGPAERSRETDGDRAGHQNGRDDTADRAGAASGSVAIPVTEADDG